MGTEKYWRSTIIARYSCEEIEAIITEAKRALSLKLYYVALLTTLTIPDICSRLESPEKWRIEHYIPWLDKYFDGYSNLTSRDIFHIRGGLVHRGHFRHPESRFDRVVFAPNDGPIRFDDAITILNSNVRLGGKTLEEIGFGGDQGGRVLMLDIDRFCNQMFAAARKFADLNGGSEPVRSMLKNLVRYRPHGIPPFIVGSPVIG